MKLERRGDTETSAPSPAEKSSPPEAGGKKPVIVYILALFLVAFLLMTLSLLVHQRSNVEALGRLQVSVSTMQEVQELQDQVIALQKELAEAKEQLDQAEADVQGAEDRSAKAQTERDSYQRQAQALMSLYQLQQHYFARELDDCRRLIAELDAGLADSLSKEAAGGVTPPAERYQELKEAVEARED